MENIDIPLFTTSCRICEGTRIKRIFISNGYPVCRCEDCGFMFLNPQPSDEVLSQIYTAEYFLMSHTEEASSLQTDMKRSTALEYLQELKKPCQKTKGNLLEIGCGNGDFLEIAQEHGFHVSGVEVSEFSVSIANSRLGQGVVKCGTIEKGDFRPGSIDICVLFDVIEHVRHPLEHLRQIHQLLKPHGVIFLVTPSLQSWSARLLKKRWMEFKTEHLHYFNEQTIQNALYKAGFRNMQISPNYKYLTLAYINQHFQRFRVPVYTQILSLLTTVLPGRLKNREFKIIASGINVLARKPEE